MANIKNMPLTIFRKTYKVYGGPYRNKPDSMYGVKMAAELKDPCSISVPTEDFSVPDPDTMRAGLLKAVEHLYQGRELYVGCMGGIGRTGLFLAALAKLSGEEDPVSYVRAHYLSYAVETREQQEYISKLDVQSLRMPLLWLRIRYSFKNLLSSLGFRVR